MKLPITSAALDRLGFSPYWDHNGTSGDRRLVFKSGAVFPLIELDEMDDENEGHASQKVYRAQHWYYSPSFAGRSGVSGDIEIYFLHELYDCIKRLYPAVLSEFCERCREANMWPYIQYHLQSTQP